MEEVPLEGLSAPGEGHDPIQETRPEGFTEQSVDYRVLYIVWSLQKVGQMNKMNRRPVTRGSLVSDIEERDIDLTDRVSNSRVV